jgi:16S rRNA (guanine966-N2)-methyltransferase
MRDVSGDSRAYPGVIRIIGGKWRGRRISVPQSSELRPTPDRVRETLFNWLMPYIEGASCLDLFAGIGALGLEALSRGAARVVFVEKDILLAEAIESQLLAFDETSRGHEAQVAACTVEEFLADVSKQTFDIVFIDPPYEQPLASTFDRLRQWLAPRALIYAERSLAAGMPVVAWAKWLRQARAGDVAYGLAQADDPIDDVL